MAKKIRKLIASLLVLCMCISAATISITAAEVPVDIETTAGTVSGTQTTTDTSTPNADGSTTQTQTVVTHTPEGGVTSTAGNTTTTVEFQETETTTTHTDAEGNLISKSGNVVGEETVTQTTTTVNSPVEEEIYTGSVEITFDEDGNGTSKVESKLPEAPADAENVQTGEDSIGWETTENEPAVPGAGNGTDVNGDDLVDTITTQTTTVTTTTVTITDRTVEADLVPDYTLPPDEYHDVEDSEVQGIGDAELPAGETWTEVSGYKQAQIEKIQDQLYFGTEDAAKAAATQLALDAILNGKEIPADTEAAIKTAAEALINASMAEDVPTTSEETKDPEITISNVSLTVNDKAAGYENNTDLDATNDVYNASVKFDVIVTEDVNGELTVVIRQNGEEVASQTLTALDKNDDGSYSVNIRDMQLQEGDEEMAIDLDIRLDGVQQMAAKQVYSHTTTTKVPAQKPDDQTLAGYTSHSGNEKQNENGNMIADTNSWNTGSHNQSFTVEGSGAKVNIQAADQNTADGREVVNVTTDKTIEADYIIIKAANGYIKYAVPGGILHAGVIYSVENDYNSEIGMTGGISHVTIWGSGEAVDIPEEEINRIILGEAGQHREVVLNAGVNLNFEVDEAIKTTNSSEEKTTTTTRTWGDSYSNSYEPSGGTPDPDPNNPGPNNPDPTPNNPPAPQSRIVVRNVDNDLTEIDDEEVPLAKAPKTGDVTTVLAAVSLFSAGGLVTLNRKKKEE
ncbi:MAG: hypothetical protein IJN20_06755 [Oscillospiraceae bacterium]|nr:hypothetical protein [Oscillospiraceae bacterium]